MEGHNKIEKAKKNRPHFGINGIILHFSGGNKFSSQNDKNRLH